MNTVSVGNNEAIHKAESSNLREFSFTLPPMPMFPILPKIRFWRLEETHAAARKTVPAALALPPLHGNWICALIVPSLWAQFAYGLFDASLDWAVGYGTKRSSRDLCPQIRPPTPLVTIARVCREFRHMRSHRTPFRIQVPFSVPALLKPTKKPPTPGGIDGFCWLLDSNRPLHLAIAAT